MRHSSLLHDNLHGNRRLTNCLETANLARPPLIPDLRRLGRNVPLRSPKQSSLRRMVHPNDSRGPNLHLHAMALRQGTAMENRRIRQHPSIPETCHAREPNPPGYRRDIPDNLHPRTGHILR